MILSKEGRTITQGHEEFDHEVHQGDVLNTLWNICSALELPYRADKESIRPRVHKIIGAVTASGYRHSPYARNPNIQYSAAQYRKTTMELDIIYGIVAIYGVQIERKQPYGCSFEDLEYDFAIAFNMQAPIVAHAFVHTTKPMQGRTWMITQRCRVSNDTAMDANISEKEEDSCLVTATASRAIAFEGRMCSFKILLHLSKASHTLDEMRLPWMINLRLDDYLFDEYPALPQMWRNGATHPNFLAVQESFLLQDAVLEVFGEENVAVLSLGVQMKSGREWGLVLLRSKKDTSEYVRLGVCNWRYDFDTNGKGPAPGLEWTRDSGIIL